MPAPLTAPEENKRRWDAFEQNGFDQTNASIALNIGRSTFGTWLLTFRSILARDKLKVPNEAFWKAHLQPKDNEIRGSSTAAEVSQEAIRIARLEQQNRALKARLDEALKTTIELEDVRAEAFGLADALAAPAVVNQEPGDGKGGHRTAVLHISDVHMGEVVSLHEMDNLNSFDAEICEARLDRLFVKAAELLTEHWSGSPVEEVVIVLGGDMIDGALREESEATAALAVIPSVQRVSEKLAGGFEYLKSKVDAPMRVYTTPGNHGRLERKPRVKQYAINSFDTMVTWSIEKLLGPNFGVPFYYTGSGEALFNVYGWWFLAQHGHMGAKGSGGMYGPVYKQVRGMYRTHQSYGRRRRGFDWVLQGHDHTTVRLPFGFGNGSIVGYNEYAAHMLKADPEPAKQNMLIVERSHGVINLQELFLGVPEEGDLYIPPEPPALNEKPRFRVQAPSVRWAL